MYNDLVCSIDAGQMVSFALLNLLSFAFDNADHAISLSILFKRAVNGPALDWFLYLL